MIFKIRDREAGSPEYIYRQRNMTYYTDGKIKGQGFKLYMWSDKVSYKLRAKKQSEALSKWGKETFAKISGEVMNKYFSENPVK